MGFPEAQYPRDVIAAGVVLFALGAIFTLVAMSPLVLPVELPGVWWFLAMLVGLGFAMIMLGLLGRARRRSRTVRAGLRQQAG